MKKVDQDSPDLRLDFLGRTRGKVRQCLEGANRSEAYPGCLLPNNVSQIHYTLAALERLDLQTVSIQYVMT